MYRTLHLSQQSVKSDEKIKTSTVLGKTGNTGLWTNKDGSTENYPYHAHEDISTSKKSPYLEYLTSKNKDVSPSIKRFDGRTYYDKFLFAEKTKYKFREDAYEYK